MDASSTSTTTAVAAVISGSDGGILLYVSIKKLNTMTTNRGFENKNHGIKNGGLLNDMYIKLYIYITISKFTPLRGKTTFTQGS